MYIYVIYILRCHMVCLGAMFGFKFSVKTHYEATNLGNFTTCIVYSVHFQNVLHLILGFTHGVWALCFDFHKFNDI